MLPTDALPGAAIVRDDLLTNVAICWFTGMGASSAQLYYEDMHGGTWPAAPSPVPTGVAVFANDVTIRRYAESANTIVHWSEFDRGGHFTPWRRRTCWWPMCGALFGYCMFSAG